MPAAVPIYRRGRTRVLALDFDAKHHGPDAVDADVARAANWIAEAGGRAVVDRSTSGGRHILVALGGAALGVEHLRPLMRLLAERLPTLDVTPMLNAATGCITVPGSPCREGGHRQLDGPLEVAVDAFTVRSEPGLVARLVALLGGIRSRAADTTCTAGSREEARIIGHGPDARLEPAFVRTSPLPTAVVEYAATGVLAGWRPSHSEARQSVIVHAVLRGATAIDITTRLDTDPAFAGVAAAYNRYGRGRAAAIARDVAASLRWAAANAPFFRPAAHKTKHTGGWGDTSFLTDPTRQGWLASALRWSDRTFESTPYRWTVQTVLQGLAYSSTKWHLVEGVPVSAMGVRGLSLAAGMLPETTAAAVLREIRDLPGSPVLLVAKGAGKIADRYALITPDVVESDPVRIGRARVEPVHPIWVVFGQRCRRLYELITYHGLSRPDDVFVAAGIGTSAGYEILAELAQAGLIRRRRGHLSAGETTLDALAAAHGLHQVRDERIERYRTERTLWHTWLTRRYAPPPPDTGTAADSHDRPYSHGNHVEVTDDAYLAAVMATGPPPLDPIYVAIDLVADELGATIIS